MRIQRAHLLALKYLYDLPTSLDQHLVIDVSLGVTPVAITHGLARIPQGWFVVKQNAGATVYTTGAGPDPTNTILLAATAPLVATLLFF